MSIPRPRRSALFMPAANARALAKARTLPCDVVILDLEDAVAPEVKTAARAQAVAAAGSFGERETVLRVNGAGTSWHADDLAATAGTGFDAVLLPKVDGVADVAAARAILGSDGPAIWAMIETARGLMALPDLAAAGPALGMAALVTGTNDLALDLRCRPGADRTPLLPHLAAIVVAARTGAMVALDGVLNAIDDTDQLTAECMQGRNYGFDGKTLIHPAQIDTTNHVFGPSRDELRWANDVIAAFADSAAMGRGAIRLNGTMVERLHLAEAKRIVALDGTAERRDRTEITSPPIR